jgi:DNA helicase HerA-like ATPase
LAYDEEDGKDIEIEKISNGEVWVVDIEAVNDRAKRLVFHNLTTRLADVMEKESLRPREERRLHGIIIFVDELNKFAPAGESGSSRIKHQIIELAARGRSLGLILFGAEQFASRVDKEVLGNASSHLLGRTEMVELRDRAYGWLTENLRFIVGGLAKGKLLLRHATYGQPVFIRFPQPMYNYSTADIEKLENRRKTVVIPTVAPEDSASTTFEVLKSTLKRQRGIEPLGVFKTVPGIKELGVGPDTFVNWYHCWVSQKKYKGRSESERKALELILKHYSK